MGVSRFFIAVIDELGNARTAWPLEDLTSPQLEHLAATVASELGRRRFGSISSERAAAPRDDYDSPAGAGESVEAFRG